MKASKLLLVFLYFIISYSCNEKRESVKHMQLSNSDSLIYIPEYLKTDKFFFDSIEIGRDCDFCKDDDSNLSRSHERIESLKKTIDQTIDSSLVRLELQSHILFKDTVTNRVKIFDIKDYITALRNLRSTYAEILNTEYKLINNATPAYSFNSENAFRGNIWYYKRLKQYLFLIVSSLIEANENFR